MTAETHLAKFGVTVQQAFDFLVANVGQPEIIFNVSKNFAITTEMLSEITTLPENIIREYFASFELDSSELDQTGIIINFDLGSFDQFVGFNTNDPDYAIDGVNISDVLSTETLRGLIQPLLNDSSSYDTVFGPQFAFQTNDAIYDADELGVSHLTVEVPATNESVESLFYGSLINMFSAFDQDELSQILGFSGDRSSDEFQMLVADAFSDVPETVVWADAAMVRLVIDESLNLINALAEDNTIVGVLDQSFLGLAVA